jgi:hypothetical protein
MEKLQMMKYSIRKDAGLNFTNGLGWTQELIEIEELQKDAVPRDIWSYEKALAVEEDDGDEDWEDLEEADEEEEEIDILADGGEEDEEDDLYADE